MAIQVWLKPQLWGYQRTADAYNYNDSGPKEDGAGKILYQERFQYFLWFIKKKFQNYTAEKCPYVKRNKYIKIKQISQNIRTREKLTWFVETLRTGSYYSNNVTFFEEV